MKKYLIFIVFCCLIILGQQVLAQEKKCATPAWVAEQFGERFISSLEIGYGDLKIPFTEEELRYDNLSWLVPLEIEGTLQYKFIQARYSPNQYESYDTLSFQEAAEFIRIIQKADKLSKFPNREALKFFLTKDKMLDASGSVSFLSLACQGLDCMVINLPKNVQISSVDKSTMFMDGALIISDNDLNKKNNLDSASFGKVMALVYLK